MHCVYRRVISLTGFFHYTGTSHILVGLVQLFPTQDAGATSQQGGVEADSRGLWWRGDSGDERNRKSAAQR